MSNQESGQRNQSGNQQEKKQEKKQGKQPRNQQNNQQGNQQAKAKVGDRASAKGQEATPTAKKDQIASGSETGSDTKSGARRGRRRSGRSGNRNNGSKRNQNQNQNQNQNRKGQRQKQDDRSDQGAPDDSGTTRGDGQKNGQNSGDSKSDGQRGSSSSSKNPQNSRKGRNRRRSGQRRKRNNSADPVGQILADTSVELDEEDLKNRRGRSRKGRPVGRYMMVVSRLAEATHIAILEGRTLIEYYVSRPSDDISQIHGNIYLGRVQNVLPGMEAAFVDIGTPKNAVIYRNDVLAAQGKDRSSKLRIEQMLKPRQPILCQVVKNPIAHKGARLTGEVSLPGRFVVFVPNSSTYGISKRLPDNERKRLRKILDRVRPKGHGLIVRTAAENVTAGEIERDVIGLYEQWNQMEKLVETTKAPSLIYREPDMAVRVIREEFNKGYRGVVIDDKALYNEVSEYVSVITPALADRVQYFDTEAESLGVLERYHIHEQLHKALDKKVWLPSGGSLIIERTEALTVIDVNTGKNVGSSNLEDTVFKNNLEAAEGIAQQLRLRDIGGIIVIDFVDMENRRNRTEVMKVFRAALARDNTRTQVFDISELGLVEMTRKRIGEGLLESMSKTCPPCDGLGLQITSSVLSGESR